MPYRTIGVLLALLTSPIAIADVTITIPDGRQVLLRDNGTWSVVEQGEDGESRRYAVLTLENKENLARGCRLGLRLQNNLSAHIRSLVLRFTAYKGEDIQFETVSRGFSFLKPTLSQYQEIQFRGITCDEITSVQVAGARNCHVGDLTKYSAEAHHCLNLVDVVHSDILPIAKRVEVD
jgi:hypothetical protein